MTEQKVALVVGASSGIGASVARRLVASNIKVYAVARRIRRLKDLNKFKIHTAYMDVTDMDSIQKVVDDIVRQEGHIDIVIYNAGYGEYGIIEEVTIENAQKQFDVNVFGFARVNQCVLPYMRRQKSGRIIVIASSASHVATLGSGWYGASKHAVKGLTEAFRMEVKQFGIDVVQIEPGPVRTEFEDVATQTMGQHQSIPAYERLMQEYALFLKNMFQNAPSIFTTVNAIVKAALISKPHKVYRTTLSARLLPHIRYLIGIEFYSKGVLCVIQNNAKLKRRKK